MIPSGSASGLLRDGGIIKERTLRAPHHTITNIGLIGGIVIPRPGEVSLSHHGVLFLDELPEFRKNALAKIRISFLALLRIPHKFPQNLPADN